MLYTTGFGTVNPSVTQPKKLYKRVRGLNVFFYILQSIQYLIVVLYYSLVGWPSLFRSWTVHCVGRLPYICWTGQRHVKHNTHTATEGMVTETTSIL